MDIEQPVLGFLGYGKMAEAVSTAVLSLDPSWPRYSYDPYKEQWPSSIMQAASAQELEEKCDIVLLCVKPQEMKNAVSGLTGNKHYISIAAGLELKTIQGYLNCENRIARVMPNLCASIGMSVNAIFCTDEQLIKATEKIFSASGINIRIKNEDQMHGVTGLSGSGPAFAMLAIQALSEAGIYEGIPAKDSVRMAAQTLKGAAELILRSDEHPGKLIQDVSSPGGTTIRGLHSLENDRFKAALMNAVIAAADRSRELS